MKYYQMHESVYQNLKQRGLVTWDRKTDLETLDSHGVNVGLLELLKKESFELAHKKTLDLGTGTGNCALFCSRQGARSTGVDISKTAIEMARENNTLLNLSATFIESDIVTLNLNQRFNLITDSSLLHCLVGESDRRGFYQTVKRHLTSDGYFYLHTMTESADMSSMLNEHFCMDGEVLYSLGIKDITEDRREFNGKSYFPHRTILKERNLIKEIEEHGFKVVNYRVKSESGEPDNFIALLKLTES